MSIQRLVGEGLAKKALDFKQLHNAALDGDVAFAAALLDHGADVDARNRDGYTALHVAAYKGQTEVAAVLLDRGADVNARTKKDRTPLYGAEKHQHPETADLLRQRGGISGFTAESVADPRSRMLARIILIGVALVAGLMILAQSMPS